MLGERHNIHKQQSVKRSQVSFSCKFFRNYNFLIWTVWNCVSIGYYTNCARLLIGNRSFLEKFAFKICWSLNSLYSVNLFQKKTLNKAELLTQFHGFAGNFEFLRLLGNFAILFSYPGQLSSWMEIFLPLHKRSDLWLPNWLIIGAFLPVILCGSVITTVVSNVFLAAQDAEHNTSTPAHQ